MSASKSSARKRVSEPQIPKSESKRRASAVEDDFDAEISDDIKGIMTALKQIREKAQQDGLKKKEETISSVTSEVKSKIDELKLKLEKDRQGFAKALSKSSKECENLLKNETAKFQSIYEKFNKEKATHLQSLRDTISKYEEEKERLFMQYEQLRKKEKSMISDLEQDSRKRISELKESLKKKKQDDKAFSFLRKTLGSFLDNASDEDFPPDD
ncbi:meiosis-specific protein ASY3-like [Solanum lycopersicum]|uniref:meiosis-specific protein ASY3-like n=1 Tax=Solanum lycopersicum TaxID=4081 RepID=UPI0002BC873A|nr:DNA ligase 1-like isoform X2 [Solanum lycopersicum]